MFFATWSGYESDDVDLFNEILDIPIPAGAMKLGSVTMEPLDGCSRYVYRVLVVLERKVHWRFECGRLMIGLVIPQVEFSFWWS